SSVGQIILNKTSTK
ncbi:unnamed protein product, partial [Allacma fusca]